MRKAAMKKGSINSFDLHTHKYVTVNASPMWEKVTAIILALKCLLHVHSQKEKI